MKRVQAPGLKEWLHSPLWVYRVVHGDVCETFFPPTHLSLKTLGSVRWRSLGQNPETLAFNELTLDQSDLTQVGPGLGRVQLISSLH